MLYRTDLPSTHEILTKHAFIDMLFSDYPASKKLRKNLDENCAKYKTDPTIDYYVNQYKSHIESISNSVSEEFILMKWRTSSPFDNILFDLEYKKTKNEDYLFVAYDYSRSRQMIDGYRIVIKIISHGNIKKHKKEICRRLFHQIAFAIDYKPITTSDIIFIRPSMWFDWGRVLRKSSSYTDCMINLSSVMFVINPYDKTKTFLSNLLQCIENQSFDRKITVDEIVDRLEKVDPFSRFETLEYQIDRLRAYTEVQRKAMIRFFREDKVGFTSTRSAYLYCIAYYLMFQEKTLIKLCETAFSPDK